MRTSPRSKRWYRHDYSRKELTDWANKILANGAKRAWIYFNNGNDAHAPKNAAIVSPGVV